MLLNESIEYVYDGLNRLIRENNFALGKTYTYKYDAAGNILSKSTYNVTSGAVVTPLNVKLYKYATSGWKDRLISYGGYGITYDTQGNPLIYRGHTLEWSRIRLLTKWDDITMEYNSNGIRTRKGDTMYELDGGNIISETTNGNTIRYYYGNDGIVGFRYNGNRYYYEKNLQGDITGICDESGNKLCEYAYDAWGNCTIKNDISDARIGEVNSFRYRGYYYDSELGLYYLKSRYYDPIVVRFINADEVEYLGEDSTVLSYNMYAYCMDNPIDRSDEDGNWSLPNWAKVAIGAVAIAGLAVATVCTGGAAAVICGAALSGAVVGGSSGAVIGAITGGISEGWQGALDGACSGFMSGTLIGGATGAASAGLNIATGATTVVGNAHGSTLHKLATNMEAGKMATSGQYSQIGVNKALKTMGLNGTSRPDVIGVAKTGLNKLVEVVSPRQSTSYIKNKMSNMLSNNPGSTGKIVTWVRNIFK